MSWCSNQNIPPIWIFVRRPPVVPCGLSKSFRKQIRNRYICQTLTFNKIQVFQERVERNTPASGIATLTMVNPSSREKSRPPKLKTDSQRTSRRKSDSAEAKNQVSVEVKHICYSTRCQESYQVRLYISSSFGKLGGGG